jgi:hypothetical protein
MNSQIQTELNEVIRDIAKADLQGRVARLLIDETTYEKQRQLLDDKEVTETVRFQIARRGNHGEMIRIEASADTKVEPRDLIEVIGGSSGQKVSGTVTDTASSDIATAIYSKE